jgi:hypothetical protein
MPGGGVMSTNLTRRTETREWWFCPTQFVWTGEHHHKRGYEFGFPGHPEGLIRFDTPEAACAALAEYAHRVWEGGEEAALRLLCNTYTWSGSTVAAAIRSGKHEGVPRAALARVVWRVAPKSEMKVRALPHGLDISINCESRDVATWKTTERHTDEDGNTWEREAEHEVPLDDWGHARDRGWTMEIAHMVEEAEWFAVDAEAGR